MKRTLVILLLLAAGAAPATAQVISTQQLTAASVGGVCTAGACATFQLPAGTSSVALDVAGTFSGTIVFEATADGSNWRSITATKLADATGATSTTAVGLFGISNIGFVQVRARVTNWSSGMAVITGNRGHAGGGGVGGGGGGGGDASAANQTTQIAHEAILTSSAEGVAPGAVGATSTLMVGGIYNATPPTFTDGQRGALQFDENGKLKVAGTSSGGASTTDADDGSIGVGQTNDNANVFSMAYDGSVWRRLTFGTAGTASTQVFTVQGISSMTPLSVTFPTAQAITVASIPSHAVTNAGTFAVQAASTQSGTWTVQPGNTANTTPWLTTPYQGGANLFAAAAAAGDSMSNPTTTGVLSYNMCWSGSVWVRCAPDPAHDAPDSGNPLKIGGKANDAAPTSVSADADRVDAWFTRKGALATLATDIAGNLPVVDPCAGVAKTTDPISITTDTVIIAAASSKKNYICSIVIVAGAAEIVSITEGTGSVCGTSEAAIVGSTTDANGLSFAANGGFSSIGGNATVIAGKTANVDMCLNVSGSNRVSGFVTWVQR